MYRRLFLMLTLAAWSILPGASRGQPQDTAKTLPPVLAELLKGSADAFIKHYDKNKDGFLTKD